jgi:hypothetical protein
LAQIDPQALRDAPAAEEAREERDGGGGRLHHVARELRHGLKPLADPAGALDRHTLCAAEVSHEDVAVALAGECAVGPRARGRAAAALADRLAQREEEGGRLVLVAGAQEQAALDQATIGKP